MMTFRGEVRAEPFDPATFTIILALPSNLHSVYLLIIILIIRVYGVSFGADHARLHTRTYTRDGRFLTIVQLSSFLANRYRFVIWSQFGNDSACRFCQGFFVWHRTWADHAWARGGGLRPPKGGSLTGTRARTRESRVAGIVGLPSVATMP